MFSPFNGHLDYTAKIICFVAVSTQAIHPDASSIRQHSKLPAPPLKAPHHRSHASFEEAAFVTLTGPRCPFLTLPTADVSDAVSHNVLTLTLCPPLTAAKLFLYPPSNKPFRLFLPVPRHSDCRTNRRQLDARAGCRGP